MGAGRGTVPSPESRVLSPESQRLLPIGRSFRRVYFVSKERYHPTWHASISHEPSRFMLVSEYLCHCVKTYNEKKQHPGPVPDRV